MSKPVKEMIARDLAVRYAEQDNAIWVEIVGVDGITTNDFRRDLRAHDMRLEVVKTSLLRRACAAGPLAPLARALEGPAALVTGGESAVEVSKLLDGWKPKLLRGQGLRVRGAVLDGEYLDEERAQGLSRMASRTDMLAKLVTIIITPGSELVSVALASGRDVAGMLKTMIDKLEQGEEITKQTA